MQMVGFFGFGFIIEDGTFALTLPSTQGIILIRQISLVWVPLSELWQDGSLPRLVVNSIFYLIIGILVFYASEQKVKKQGSLGQY
jgi:ABC-2 type transport system permease protein